MKKIYQCSSLILCIFFISFFSCRLHAQSWSLTGNTGIIPGTHFLGTTDEQPLELRTGNITRLSVAPDGPVKIFEDDDGEALEIHGFTTFKAEVSVAANERLLLQDNAYLRFNNTTANGPPMIYMFYSQPDNFDRMVLAHSTDYPHWGLEYQDVGDKFHFRTESNRRFTVNLQNGRVGIGKETPAYQLHLSFNSARKPTSSTWTVASDQRLKKDIADFTDGMNVIEKIHPVWFSYTGDAGMPADERGVGTIAQELQKVAPYMVHEWTYTDEESGKETKYLDVDYHALFFMFINAFKEQQQEIEELQSEVESRKSEAARLTAVVKNQQRQIDELKLSIENHQGQATNEVAKPLTFNLKPSVAIGLPQAMHETILGQNIPNPFDHCTIIPFRIPNDCKDASLVIAESSTGRVVSALPITCNESQVTIQAGSLLGGSYSYSLIVDGKIMDTKRMELLK